MKNLASTDYVKIRAVSMESAVETPNVLLKTTLHLVNALADIVEIPTPSALNLHHNVSKTVSV